MSRPRDPLNAKITNALKGGPAVPLHAAHEAEVTRIAKRAARLERHKRRANRQRAGRFA